jgi:hypothetical protein
MTQLEEEPEKEDYKRNNHINQGKCPAPNKPDSLDPECPACKAEMRAARVRATAYDFLLELARTRK